MMDSPLVIRAGHRALAHLRERGLTPNDIGTLVGASGGPKWLVLAAMDRVWAHWLVAGRDAPLHLLGSSIGTWRHACFAQTDPVAAFERFEEAYVAQSYTGQPTAACISRVSRDILGHLLAADGARAIATHPLLRSHVVTARSRWPVATDRRVPLALGIGGAALANVFARPLVGNFFQRVVFHTGHACAFGFHGFATKVLPLPVESVPDAILASGSIPLVMKAVRMPPAAPPGLYRDGGIVDYHFDFCFERPPGLTLYPHFFDRITPGWFDKALRWRRPAIGDLDDVLLVAPSAAFVATLPGGKVPDRDDFQTLPTAERITAWRAVLDATRHLADALDGLLAHGRLAEIAQPFTPA